MTMKTVVMIPTFNERENVAELIERLLELPVSDLHVLIVDDDSPDGTAQVVRDRFGRDTNVHLLVRRDGRGRGRAGRDGFLHALALGADAVVEMDGDLSHDPRDVPRLLAELEHADIVVGSRTAAGGEDPERRWHRRWLSTASRMYVRCLLGSAVADCTSGFRCFERRALEAIDPRTLASEGPAIVEEVLFRAQRRALRIVEIPIAFQDRKRGKSKLGLKAVLVVALTILRLRLRAAAERRERRSADAGSPPSLPTGG
jgi:dolichol-phosphate mannosyltransferase